MRTIKIIKRETTVPRKNIRNAVKKAKDKRKAENTNSFDHLQSQLKELGEIIDKYNPLVILTFGRFAFEFVRRASGEQGIPKISDWGAETLGIEFRERIDHFNPAATNVLPLLHVSISRGKFLESHSYFIDDDNKETNNYFEYVGIRLAKLLIERMQSITIWLDAL